MHALDPHAIRTLNPVGDLAKVIAFYQDAPDYWKMAEGRAPDIQKAKDFFIDGPPGCNPARSHRLGLFHGGGLSGLAALSVNVRGRAFWEREGFQVTGLSGMISAGELEMEAHRLRKPL